jgi:exonuclease III
MMTHQNTLEIAYLNIHGQSKLGDSKQRQIDHFLSFHNIDILHLQESHLNPNTFDSCQYISENFETVYNNSPTKYGVASIIKNNLTYDNLRMDLSGRIIVFDIGNITFFLTLTCPAVLMDLLGNSARSSWGARSPTF